MERGAPFSPNLQTAGSALPVLLEAQRWIQARRSSSSTETNLSFVSSDGNVSTKFMSALIVFISEVSNCLVSEFYKIEIKTLQELQMVIPVAK